MPVRTMRERVEEALAAAALVRRTTKQRRPSSVLGAERVYVEDVMRVLEEQRVFERPPGAPPLEAVKHVARDAWLEAGGCARCWGTGVHVVETLNLHDSVQIGVYGCLCEGAAREIGLCPDIPLAYQSVVIVALAKLIRRDETPLAQGDVATGPMGLQRLPGAATYPTGPQATADAEVVAQARADAIRERLALMRHLLPTLVNRVSRAEAVPEPAALDAMDDFLRRLSDAQVAAVFGSDVDAIGYREGVLTRQQVNVIVGRRRDPAWLDALLDGPVAITQDQLAHLQRLLPAETLLPLVDLLLNRARERARA